jgi:hypothetical protein
MNLPFFTRPTYHPVLSDKKKKMWPLTLARPSQDSQDSQDSNVSPGKAITVCL